MDGDVAAVGLDGEPATGETQSATGARRRAVVVLDLRKRFEDLLAQLLGDPDAGVANADLDGVSGCGGRDGDRALFRRVTKRIVDQIRDNTLEEVGFGREPLRP